MRFQKYPDTWEISFMNARLKMSMQRQFSTKWWAKAAVTKKGGLQIDGREKPMQQKHKSSKGEIDFWIVFIPT